MVKWRLMEESYDRPETDCVCIFLMERVVAYDT